MDQGGMAGCPLKTLQLVMGIFEAFFVVYIEFISFAVRFFSLPLKPFQLYCLFYFQISDYDV